MRSIAETRRLPGNGRRWARVPPPKAAGLVAALLLLPACATTVLLSNDFEDYDEGTPLVGPIPGAPSGDGILSAAPGVSLVTATIPNVFSGRVMRVVGLVAFEPRDHTAPEDYQIVWTGSHEDAAASAVDTTIRFLDASDDAALVLRMDGSNLDVVGDNRFSVGNPVFNHTFSVILHMSAPCTDGAGEEETGCFELTFTEHFVDDSETSSFPPGAFRDSIFSKLDRIEIEAHSGNPYRMDNLRVLARYPD